MRLGPATQAALLSRTFCWPLFAVAKNHRAPALRRAPCLDAHLKLAPQSYDSTFPPFSKEGFLRRPLSPGTGTLDMHRFSPDDSLSRKSPATLNPCQSCFRTSHAFDCKHFAAAEKLTQPQTAPPLCKNCGGEKLPVERKGKAYFYSRGAPYNTSR